MKTTKHANAGVGRVSTVVRIRRHHYLLVEAMIYIAVLAVVTGLAFSLFYRGFANSRNLRQAADDVLRVSRLGDRWRTQVREAAAIRVDARAELSIVRPDGKAFFYKFADGAIQERESEAGPWRILMPQVRSCVFEETRNPGFNTWELKVELSTRTPNAKIRPLFSFMAVNRKDINS